MIISFSTKGSIEVMSVGMERSNGIQMEFRLVTTQQWILHKKYLITRKACMWIAS